MHRPGRGAIDGAESEEAETGLAALYVQLKPFRALFRRAFRSVSLRLAPSRIDCVLGRTHVRVQALRPPAPRHPRSIADADATCGVGYTHTENGHTRSPSHAAVRLEYMDQE